MISLDWTLFVQMAIFLAFMVYLNNFLLKPLAAYVARRKKTIEGLQESGGEQDAAEVHPLETGVPGVAGDPVILAPPAPQLDVQLGQLADVLVLRIGRGLWP